MTPNDSDPTPPAGSTASPDSAASAAKPTPRERPLRWIGLAIGLAVAGVDTALASALGIAFTISELDPVTLVWTYLALTLGVLGYVIGWLIESRRRERRARDRVHEQLGLLQALQQRLSEREKLAVLGQLAATIAHEVRNPLAIIRSTLQNISEELADAQPDVAEQHSFLLEEIDRLSRVLTTILDYARPMQVKPEAVPASQLFERLELLASGLLAEKQLALETRCDDIDVWVDPDLIAQAMLGLLANGVEATPRGHSLTLSAKRAEGGVALSVADRGPGVPADQRATIFEPFFTTKQRGSGLGLAVAKRIIEAHDGTIEVSDRSGGGALFAIHLPAPAAASANPRDDSPTNGQPDQIEHS
ncbi:MAG: hypothetical protein Tsb0020_03820 [Haliangiales bacterium]